MIDQQPLDEFGCPIPQPATEPEAGEENPSVLDALNDLEGAVNDSMQKLLDKKVDAIRFERTFGLRLASVLESLGPPGSEPHRELCEMLADAARALYHARIAEAEQTCGLLASQQIAAARALGNLADLGGGGAT